MLKYNSNGTEQFVYVAFKYVCSARGVVSDSTHIAWPSSTYG